MTTAMRTTSMALLAAVAGLTLAGCSKSQSAAPTAAQPLTVTVAPVEQRPLAEGLTASGLLVSREEAAVASELSGYRVAEVLVDEAPG